MQAATESFAHNHIIRMSRVKEQLASIESLYATRGAHIQEHIQQLEVLTFGVGRTGWDPRQFQQLHQHHTNAIRHLAAATPATILSTKPPVQHTETEPVKARASSAPRKGVTGKSPRPVAAPKDKPASAFASKVPTKFPINSVSSNPLEARYV
jgi:hypothetical protein